MHALHKILMAHAHPRPSTVALGEFLQIEPDVFAVQVATNAEVVDRLEAAPGDLGVKDLPLRQKNGGCAQKPRALSRRERHEIERYRCGWDDPGRDGNSLFRHFTFGAKRDSGGGALTPGVWRWHGASICRFATCRRAIARRAVPYPRVRQAGPPIRVSSPPTPETKRPTRGL